MFLMIGLLSLLLMFSSVLGNQMSPNIYCADMRPQPHVIIEQLMGMWYGIEIISHKDQHHYIKTVSSCPILHLSEYRDVPYYNSRDPYQQRTTGYGYAGSPYNADGGYYSTSYTQRPHYGRINPQDYNRDYNRDNSRGDYNRDYKNSNNRQYETGRTYAPNYSGSPYNQNEYIRRQHQQLKQIKIWWDEDGVGTEYILKYNISRAGFWISSGPKNGSSLDPKYSHFAGTVQVIKAVGNHLVLTFCHLMPDPQLFTILLARENRLDYVEVHGVHNMLNRRGLSTNAIKKVCNSNGGNGTNSSFAIILTLVSYFMCKILR